MKITKSKLQQIIREELNLINESPGMAIETGSELIDFAKAYASLGAAVQEQVDQIVSAYYNNGEDSDGFKEAAYEVNPNALDLAMERLARPLRMMGGATEAEEILIAIEEAQSLHNRGDKEVELDAAAAGDR
jgi:hypothetical protein